jgi:protein involved in polysaccharide export with SLBB domain
MGRSVDVNVTIVERPPIYVVGPVKNPGAYKYLPGMIVLHAIALAGGLDRGQERLLGIIESVREMERSRGKADQVKRLLARRARLEAQRDGSSILPVPVQLAQLAGEQNARTFLASESALLQAEQARHAHQENEIARRTAAARREVETLKRKLEQADVQKQMRIERLNDMQKLKDRGIVTTHTVVTLRTELSDIEAHRQDYLVAIAQAEVRLTEVEGAAARLQSERKATLAKEIAALEQEIATAQQEMTAAGTLATIIYGAMSATPLSQAYEIVRRSKEGPRTLQATDTSSLMPGDVVKIVATASTVPGQPERMLPELLRAGTN